MDGLTHFPPWLNPYTAAALAHVREKHQRIREAVAARRRLSPAPLPLIPIQLITLRRTSVPRRHQNDDGDGEDAADVR